MTDKTDLLDRIETNSSIFEKTSRDLRRQINQAIVDRSPPTYRAAYEHFCLSDFQISFHAFYRYARRLRFHAATLDLAELAMPEGTSVNDMLPELLAQRLLEAALDESVSAHVIHRLAESWRIASGTRFAHDRRAIELEDLKNRQAASKNVPISPDVRRQMKAAIGALRARLHLPPNPIPDDDRPREGEAPAEPPP